jgi:hypothetical protein
MSQEIYTYAEYLADDELGKKLKEKVSDIFTNDVAGQTHSIAEVVESVRSTLDENFSKVDDGNIVMAVHFLLRDQKIALTSNRDLRLNNPEK